MTYIAWVAVLVWLLLVRFDWPSAQADLYPSPDAIQYTTSAWNMSAGLGYTVLLGGELHPPRYPIGFPLTLMPVYWLGGTQLHHATWAVLMTSMLLFVPVALFTARLFGAKAALWAVLFVGLSPLLLQHSTRIMSEALTVLLVAGIYSLEARKAGPLVLGLLGGFAACVRYTNVMALLPTTLRFVFARSWKERVRGILGLGLGVALFVGPMAVDHHFAFGSFSRDGYAYWHPDRYENAGFVFDWEYAWKAPTVTWTRRPVGLFENYGRDLVGLNNHLYSPVVPILALLGILLALRAERGLPFSLSTARFLLYPLFLYVFYSFYYGEDRRFFLPVLIPCSALAALGAHWLCQQARPALRPLVVLLIVGALVATSRPDVRRTPPRKPQLRHEFAQAYDRALPKDAVLITTLDVLYLEYYFVKDTQRRVIALDGAVAHATVLAPHRLPSPPHRSLPAHEFRLWALAHGARHPVPVLDAETAATLDPASTPIFLESELSQKRLQRRLLPLGFGIQPVSEPGIRRLYRLFRTSQGLLPATEPD